MGKKQLYFAIAPFLVGLVLGRLNPLDPAQAQPVTLLADSEYTIERCINPFDPEKIEKSANGFMYWYVSKELSQGLNLKLSEVNPGTAHHGAHQHPESEIYFVLSGSAELIFNGESKTVGANTAMYCPPHVSHGIRNAGNTPLQYFVIKTN